MILARGGAGRGTRPMLPIMLTELARLDSQSTSINVACCSAVHGVPHAVSSMRAACSVCSEAAPEAGGTMTYAVALTWSSAAGRQELELSRE